MKNYYTKEQDENIIKVSKNTNLVKLIFYCQKLLKDKNLKELNLCAIGNAIVILDKACIELMNQNSELFRLNKLSTISLINKYGQNETRTENLKLDIKLILGKPTIIPEGYKDKFTEEEKQKLNYIYDKNQIQNTINANDNKQFEFLDSNELKIILYPEKQPRYQFKKEPIQKIISKDVLHHSLEPNKRLAFLDQNAPLLSGFYTAHINHYPIRIKPDDIWLLIVQAFSNHVNANSEKLREYFVNFEGKEELIIKYPISYIEEVTKKHIEDFSEQINNKMIEYLGEEIINILTPNFSTTTYDSKIICKISIMGAFKKYFDYTMMLVGCGIPYIILEGKVDDYKQIKAKAEKLKKYEFNWYINRIMPYIEKMIEAKEGKVDINFFKDIIQKKEVTEIRYKPSGGEYGVKVDYICGWLLQFFAYLNKKGNDNKIMPFTGESLRVEDFKDLASQMLIVPFKIIDVDKKEFLMKYKVGFIGCDQNSKNEVIPVQGWIVSTSTKEERESIL